MKQTIQGAFVLLDLLQQPILMEWEVIQGGTERLNEKIHEIQDVLVQSYTQTETDFVYTRPDLIPTDFMLKSLANALPLEHIASVDRKIVQNEVAKLLQNFFANTNWTGYSSADDSYVFVSAKDGKTGALLGAMQFWLSPKFGIGSVKSALAGVMPDAHNRGIEALLMCSILAIHKDTQHIFLHTRSTNNDLIKLYVDLGFVECTETLPNWTNLEYRVDHSAILQQLSQKLVIQE